MRTGAERRRRFRVATERAAALVLAWAYDDPGVVHLRERDSDHTLCDARALPVDVSRRKLTFEDCFMQQPRVLGAKS